MTITSWPSSRIAAAIYAKPIGGILMVETKFVSETNLGGSIRQTFIGSLESKMIFQKFLSH